MRVCCAAVPLACSQREDSQLWTGCKSGSVFVIDTKTNKRLADVGSPHSSPIICIARNRDGIVTIDRSGCTVHWEPESTRSAPFTPARCVISQLPLAPDWATAKAGKVWAYAYDGDKDRHRLLMCDVMHDRFRLLCKKSWTSGQLGRVTCATNMLGTDMVVLGHRCG